MKPKTLLLSIVITAILIGCNNEQDNKAPINPLDELAQVDHILAEMAEQPQKLNASSNKKSTLEGAQGTIIHLDPNQLETIDGSPLGDDIQIELLEMTDQSSMLLNNAQTVSNGKILVTGGAYYLNMTSAGKQVKIKEGEGLEVEFPKLTKDAMELFLGERDSLGQMNWVQAAQNFESKKLEAAQMPKSPKSTKKKTYSELDLILGHIENKKVEPLTQEEIKEYERRKREYKTASKTYQAIQLTNFGWINCDRFWDDSRPKTDIQLLVNNDSLSGVRMYAVFSDINSIMTAHYWKGMKDTASFKNIPVGQDLTVIALTAKDETPYIFETTINTKTDHQVQIQFTATTQSAIEEKIKSMN